MQKSSRAKRSVTFLYLVLFLIYVLEAIYIILLCILTFMPIESAIVPKLAALTHTFAAIGFVSHFPLFIIEYINNKEREVTRENSTFEGIVVGIILINLLLRIVIDFVLHIADSEKAERLEEWSSINLTLSFLTFTFMIHILFIRNLIWDLKEEI